MFDKSKPYGECIGGPNHGRFVQDERIFGQDGDEYDQAGNKLTKSGKPEKEVKKPAKEPEVVSAVAAQMQE